MIEPYCLNCGVFGVDRQSIWSVSNDDALSHQSLHQMPENPETKPISNWHYFILRLVGYWQAARTTTV